MRTGELECFHGQGHSAGVHGCDGCCTKLFNYLLDSIKAKAWQDGIEAFDAAITRDVDDPWSQLPENPYRQGETE